MEVIRQTRSTPRARLTPCKPLVFQRRRTKKSPVNKNLNNNDLPVSNSNAIDIIESSQDVEPQFLIERDTCQMSPLLFDSSDSQSDFETSTPYANAPNGRSDSPMTISDSPIPNNQECAKRDQQEKLPNDRNDSPMTISDSPIPNNQEGVKRTQKTPTTLKSNVLKRTPRSARRSLLLKRTQCSSRSTLKYDQTSDSELSCSTDQTPPPRRASQKRSCKKGDPILLVEDEIANTPHLTRSKANAPRIATRSKISSGQLKNFMEPPRPKSKKPRGRPTKTQPTQIESSLETIPSDNAPTEPSLSQSQPQNQLGESESSALESLTISQRLPLKPDDGPDFDLNVRLESSQEVQIIEHKDMVISLTSSGETSMDRRESQKKTDKKEGFRFEKSVFGQSPDLFDTFEDDKPLLELPRRKNMFLDNRRMSFFDRLGVPKPTVPLTSSAPQRSKKREPDTSIDMFGDNATCFGENRRMVPISEPIIEPKLHESRTSNANSSSVFEITRNDVFSNMLRVNSDSDMSPIKMSDDDQPATVAGRRASQENTPRRRPSCLEGLQIQRKHQSKENVSDPDALDTGVIAATPQEETPQRKLSLYERLCRSDPMRKKTHRKQKATAGSQGSPDRRRKKVAATTGTSPDHRKKRMTKLSSDERLNKGSTWKGRRLDDYFKKAASNSEATASTTDRKPADMVFKNFVPFEPKISTVQLLILSSDDDA